MGRFFVLVFFVVCLSLGTVSGAHFIIGEVRDSHTGVSADGRVVTVWNPDNGVEDNVTDVVGVTGNSGTENIFMVDCELLSIPCVVGDTMSVYIFVDDSYQTPEVNVSVTGAGFDVASAVRLNSPPSVVNVSVDDVLSEPAQEVDLSAASKRFVVCEGIVVDLDGDKINATGEFFSSALSGYGLEDDNNYHYTNESCYVDESFGNGNESYAYCGFEVEYYASSGNWECYLKGEDNYSSDFETNYSVVNTLLSLELNSTIDFGFVSSSEVSDEAVVTVKNRGNVPLNLSVSGWGAEEGDGLAMNCSIGGNISVEHQKFNFTESNSGPLTFDELNSLYRNMSAAQTVYDFALGVRQNDLDNDAFNNTYWRIYVPPKSSGTCDGTIIVGASSEEGI